VGGKAVAVVTAASPSKPLTWLLWFAFAVLVAGMPVAAYLHVSAEWGKALDKEGETLAAVVSLKAGQIAEWRQERLGDARVIEANAALVDWVIASVTGDASPARVNAVLRWMAVTGESYHYSAVFVLDENGHSALRWDARTGTVNRFESGLVAECRTAGVPAMSELEIGDDGTPLIDIVVPLRRDAAGAAPRAFVVLRIDPRENLFPLIRSWPVPSATAELELVRRDGDTVVYLNELRHRQGLALRLRRPIDESTLPAAAAARGRRGAMQGVDYRGVAVLAAGAPVSGSPWTLVGKVDRDEIWAPVKRSAVRTGAGLVLLLASVGAVLGLVWRRRSEEVRRREDRADVEREAILQHFETVNRFANDIILLADPDGRVVQCNDRALEAYGYSRDAVGSFTVADLRAPSARGELEKTLRMVREQGNAIYETLHLHGDGTPFPVEVSVRTLDISGRTFYQGIIRDIGERKGFEERLHAVIAELEETNQRLRLLVEGTPHFFLYTHDLEGRVTYVSPSVATITGRTDAEWVGQSHWFSTDSPINDLARQRTRRHVRGEFPPGPVQVEVAHKDGRPILLEAYETGLYRDGRLVAIQGIAHDVTEQARARERIELLAHAVRSSGEGICVTDSGNVIEFVNDAFCTMYGYGRDELIGRHIDIVRTPGFDPQQDEEILQRTLAGEFRGEVWNRRKDGSDMLIHLSTSPVRDGEGRPLTLIGVCRDVTEERRAEQALQEALEWQRRIFEGSRDAAFITDEDSHFIAVNAAATRLTGYSRDELLAMRIPDLHEEVDLHAWELFHTRIMAGEEILSEAPVKRKDGGKVDVEFNNSAITIGGRRFMHTTARDVTERRQADRALAESEARYRHFFEDDLTGDFITTADGRLLDCNPAFLRILGFVSKEEATRTPMWEIYPSRESREAYLRLVRERRSLTYHEQELRNRRGEPVHVIANVIGTFEGDELVEIKGYIFDVTAHKAVEEQLRHAQKMEALGRVAGGVAHDFNNLLQAMLSTVQLLRFGAHDTAATVGAAVELEGLVKRGASLARQLLLFARRGVTRPGRIDLNALVVEVERLLARLVPDNVRLVIEKRGEELAVDGDQGQLEQVLTNLIVNAADAMPDGGRITVRTGRDEQKQVWVEVADTGTGIPQEHLERIFDPFFTTKEAGRGTGLGLSVVLGIVTQHGGRVEVESEVGHGSAFRVVLPGAGSGPFRSVGAEPRQNGASTGGRERILLVEDAPEIRQLLVKVLEPLGYEVAVATSAEEAGLLPAEPPFDLLLTDVSLPGASGSELAHGLHDRWPGLKVILMSGYAEDEALRGEITKGRLRFLQKPIELDILTREVRAALDG
jgi:two-component system cell cycle sensor histidine kinase/response regulator CckA